MVANTQPFDLGDKREDGVGEVISDEVDLVPATGVTKLIGDVVEVGGEGVVGEADEDVDFSLPGVFHGYSFRSR